MTSKTRSQKTFSFWVILVLGEDSCNIMMLLQRLSGEVHGVIDWGFLLSASTNLPAMLTAS